MLTSASSDLIIMYLGQNRKFKVLYIINYKSQLMVIKKWSNYLLLIYIYCECLR